MTSLQHLQMLIEAADHLLEQKKKVGRWLTASESARSEDHVKNPFKNLFGSSNESEQDRLTQAEAHISQCKGVYDHYNMQGVVDTVRQFTNVKDFTVVEAVQIVNKKRAERGWEPVCDEEILSTDPEIGSVFCLWCRIRHSGGQC
jgi:hypothetical protein